MLHALFFLFVYLFFASFIYWDHSTVDTMLQMSFDKFAANKKLIGDEKKQREQNVSR